MRSRRIQGSRYGGMEMNNKIEVIRCKDCVHSKPSYIGGELLYCRKHKQSRAECGFCSDGGGTGR